jgi:hypothetical protein
MIGLAPGTKVYLGAPPIRNQKFADLYGGFSVKWFFGLLPVPCLERKGRSQL